MTPEEVWNTVNDFIILSDEDARIKYNLGEDSRDWKISFAKADLMKGGLDKAKIAPIAYRQFDNRYTYFTGNSRGYHSTPRENIMRHFINKDNLALNSGKYGRKLGSYNFFVSNSINSKDLVSALDNVYTFPLYTYEKTLFKDYADSEQTIKIENFTQKFREFVNGLYSAARTPEQIMGYIYAILYSPAYRSKYAEFLKIDFPRVPFTPDEKLFLSLSQIGWDLIQRHLLKTIPTGRAMGIYVGAGNNTVDKPDYRESRLYINPTQYFDKVPLPVHEFHIGGYQVLNKYLKDRKGRILTLDEIENVEKVVKVLDYTITAMNEIDVLTKEWI